MGDRYLKREIETLKRMYPSALKEDIMVELSNREWTAVSKYARYRLRLHRTSEIKGEQMLAGKLKAKQKREEKNKSG